MGIVIRQSSWSLLLSFAGIVMGYVNVLYLYPSYFSANEIGIARVIQDFAMLLVPFAQLGTRASIIRFFPSMQNDSKKKEAFFTMMLFMAVCGFIIFAVISYLIKEPLTGIFIAKSPEVPQYFLLVLLLISIMVVHNVISDFARSNLEIVMPNFLKEVLLRLLTTVSIGLYIIEWVNFDQFLYCIVGIYFINLIILSIYLFSKTSTQFRFDFYKSFSIQDIKPIFTYGMFTLLGTGGAIIVTKVDIVMVTSMLGTFETGVYATAFYMAVIIEIPRRIVTQISAPLLSRYLESGNSKDISELYTKSSLNLFIIGFLFFIGLWANLDNIYYYIPNNEIYAAGKWVVVIIGIGKLIDMSFGLNGEIIVLSKYYKVNIILTGFLAFITIGSNLVLIPLYGFTGAAVGTLLSLVLFNLLKFLFVKAKFKIQPFRVNHIKLLIIGTGILITALLIPSFEKKWMDIILRSGAITLLYVGLVWGLKLSDEIVETIQKIGSRLKSIF